MPSKPSETHEVTNYEHYSYLTADVTRNSKGFNVAVTVRTRPGETDNDTLLRLHLAYEELRARYPTSV